MNLGAIKRMLSGERGSTMPEYALLLSCLAIVIIPALTIVGEQSNTTFTQVGDALYGQTFMEVSSGRDPLDPTAGNPGITGNDYAQGGGSEGSTPVISGPVVDGDE